MNGALACMPTAKKWLALATLATLALVACAEPKAPSTAAPASDRSSSSSAPFASSAPPSSSPPRDCLVVQPDFGGHPSSVEGTLQIAEGDGAKHGAAPSLVLRLARPRCIVGLEHASYIAEVFVASAGGDLRPLVGARVRITGDLLAGASDMGGAAVVILANDVERLPATGGVE